VALRFEPFLIFLNPGLQSCIENCLNRPWEPHKYPSKPMQDANLQFLLAWATEYYTRDGPMSLNAHQAVCALYAGRKVEFQRVPQLNPPEAEVLAWLRSGLIPRST